jgi:hypothetical protein
MIRKHGTLEYASIFIFIVVKKSLLQVTNLVDLLNFPCVAIKNVFQKSLIMVCVIEETGTAFPSLFLVVYVLFICGVVFLFLFVFVMCLVYPMLSVSLDCSFLIAPSFFSSVYFVPNTKINQNIFRTLSVR